MKQGKLYTKIVFTALLCAILTYLGYAVVSALRAPMLTIPAIEYASGLGLRTTGFVARDETVLTSDEPITTPAVGEGEKVGVGALIATGYASSDAQARQVQLAALTAQLRQLEYAASYKLSGAADAAGLDAQIVKDISLLAQNVTRRDFSAAAELTPELKGLVLRRATGQDNLPAIERQLAQLQTELASFQTQSGGEARAITTTTSGYFSGTVDGFETVLTPARLLNLNVADFDALTAQPPDSGAFGRLIGDATWYYVTAVPPEYLKDSTVGDDVSISFSHDFYSTLHMRIARIGDDEDGRRMLVLQTYDYIQDVTLLREQTANIVFHTYEGLRVPKDALRMDEEGRTGVFILESANAKWKPVDILYDNGESYVVALDKSTTDHLWPGDAIIVGAQALYDGKVVR